MHRLRSRLAVAALCWAALGAAPSPWWPLDPQNTLVVETTKGRIVIEMRPDFAPQSVARVKSLSREGVYDGLLFHRVIDHFVDQTGNPNNHDGGVSNHPNLPPEFFTMLAPKQIDAIATHGIDGITGFVGPTPFAAGAPQPDGKYRAWGIYCACVVGMGRQADPGTGNSEIFFMRDSARRLDHEYTVWGRVVQGLDVVRAIAVGVPPAHPDKMLHVHVMADMPPAAQPQIDVIDTQSDQFKQTVAETRAQLGADFSVCDVPIAIKAK